MQAALDRELFAFVILELPDARSAWQRTPYRVSGWRTGRQPGLILVRVFGSSILRFFALNRRNVQCDSVGCCI